MPNQFQVSSMTFDGAAVPAKFHDRRWDVAVIGDPQVDKRSQHACDFAAAHSKQHFKIRYFPNEISLDGEPTTHGAIRTKFRGAKSILIEATAMTCPEILYALRDAMKEGINDITFLYLEPIEYRRRIKGDLTAHRDFDLSTNSRFRSLHGFMANFTEIPVGQAVFFLGYEKARLGQALEQEETLGQWKKHAVFGIPAFEPSWEIDNIANNVQHLASTSYHVQYAAAASVTAAYELLNGLIRDDKTDSPIIVAPLGTKPHTIGASLFLIEHNEFDRAILLFDHPQKTSDRSFEKRRWHLFDVRSA